MLMVSLRFEIGVGRYDNDHEQIRNITSVPMKGRESGQARAENIA